MLTILAQAAAPSPVVNINVPASNPWPVVAGALVGALAVFGSQWLAHRFTAQRDRKQKLRDGYAEFAAAAFRYLRITSDLVTAHFGIGNLLLMQGREGWADIREQEHQRMQDKATEIRERQQDAVHAMRETQCKLMLLIGEDLDSLKDIERMYLAVRDIDYEEIPGLTEQLPSEAIKQDGPSPEKGSLLEARVEYMDANTKHNNMRDEVERWIIGHARRLT